MLQEMVKKVADTECDELECSSQYVWEGSVVRGNSWIAAGDAVSVADVEFGEL